MKILLFAGLKEALGEPNIDIAVKGKSVLEIKEILAEQFPKAENLIRRSHFAIGQDYVSDSHVFQSQPDEIAIIPPVSGG